MISSSCLKRRGRFCGNTKTQSNPSLLKIGQEYFIMSSGCTLHGSRETIVKKYTSLLAKGKCRSLSDNEQWHYSLVTGQCSTLHWREADVLSYQSHVKTGNRKNSHTCTLHCEVHCVHLCIVPCPLVFCTPSLAEQFQPPYVSLCFTLPMHSLSEVHSHAIWVTSACWPLSPGFQFLAHVVWYTWRRWSLACSVQFQH